MGELRNDRKSLCTKRLREVGGQRMTEKKEAPRGSAPQNRGGLSMLSNPAERLLRGIKRSQFSGSAQAYSMFYICVYVIRKLRENQ